MSFSILLKNSIIFICSILLMNSILAMDTIYTDMDTIKEINPSPLTSYIGHGFDSKKGTYNPAPIFKWTYNEGQTIFSPYSDVTFDVPDQMVITPSERMEKLVMSGNHSIYERYLDTYRKWFTFDVGMETKTFKAGLYYNKTLKYVHEQLTDKNQYMLHGYYYWTFNIASLYPIKFLKLNSMTQMSIDNFPSKLVTEDDYEYAYQFIQTFGTHIVYKGFGGAKVDFHTAVENSLNTNYSKEWIVEQYGLYFKYQTANLTIDGGSNGTKCHVSKTFLNNTNFQISYYGGDPQLADTTTMKEWVKSLDRHIAPLNSTMIGIWNLFKDPITRKTVIKYVNDYMNDSNKTLRGSNIVKHFKNKRYNPINNKHLKCLGSGIDYVTMHGCVGSVYEVNHNNTFEMSIPESRFTEQSVIMENKFNVDAYFHYKHTSHKYFGFGKKTTEIYKYYSQRYTHQQSLDKAILSISYVKYVAPPFNLQMTKIFKKAVDTLPVYSKSDENSVSEYNQFIQSWGVAVIDEIILGGYCEINMWYNNTLNDKYSSEEISKYSSWSFFNIVHSKHGTDTHNSKKYKEFAKNINFEVKYSGGDLTLGIDEFDKWSETVKSNMQIVEYHLQPIVNYIEDDIKRGYISLAIEDYSDKSSQELEEYINSLNI